MDEAFIKERNIEMDFLEPAYKGKDIKSGKLLDRGVYVFYPYIENNSGKTVPIEENELIEKCPNLYQYLLEHKEELLGRRVFCKKLKKMV